MEKPDKIKNQMRINTVEIQKTEKGFNKITVSIQDYKSKKD